MVEDLKTKTNDARQGETSGHMRWVLGISLAAVVVGFSATYFWTRFA
ncbi:hypothetical protein BPNPMPFG_008370 (plasmid) [Mesorhizobium sp. AR07]|nr:hypothetical protein [Mesorhizobium sp. AR07]UVK49407.1 hypothetical protein BPNPMPFG_008370 [Mesorhizobium sp. AR07]